MLFSRGPRYLKTMRAATRWLFEKAFDAEVVGKENIPPADKQCLYVVNHLSFIDAPLVGTHLPQNTIWPVSIQASNKWYFKLAQFLMPVNCFRMDALNPLSMRQLMRHLRDNPNENCVIFPEARLTQTGSLMKFYDGTGLVASKLGLKVVPIVLEGLEHTAMGHMGKYSKKSFPKVRMTIRPAQELSVPDDLKLTMRQKRRYLADKLHDMFMQDQFASKKIENTLFGAVRESAMLYGLDKKMIEDINRTPTSYKKILLGAEVLGRKINEFTAQRENVGVMLPNAVGAAVTVLGLNKFGRVPAMLNFTAGLQNVRNACKTAEIKTILTSRVFVEKGRLEDLVAGLEKDHKVVYLEDVRETISLPDKLKGLLNHKKYKPVATADDPAVILFTSGSEGTPKGVVLSNKNLLANAHQLVTACDFRPTDKVFSCLPVFHSFGLAGGITIPLLFGVPVFMYPSPLHIRMVPEMIYDTLSTIMFGTDTFLSRYARFAHRYDFHSVRLCFAGAEKLKEETRQTYLEKFGLRVFGAYGVTEASPGISINTPLKHKTATVGKLLSGMEYKLEEVPGIEEGKRLFVKGPNVMMGYMKIENPGLIEPLEGGWHDTGDVVTFDEDGYMQIVGRAKRFAKIGGEMVSLTAAEDFVNSIWPNKTHAVIAVPDDRKGESLLLVTEAEDATRKTILEHARAKSMGELFVPRKVKVVPKVPLLGSGKVDYPAVEKLVNEE